MGDDASRVPSGQLTVRVFAVKPLRAKDFPVAQTRGEAHRSDLPAVDRRRFYDAIVSSMIEGATPNRESVLLLIDFAAGRIDIGAADKSLIEFKLASNRQLKRNLQNQVEIYEKANDTATAVTVIVAYSAAEHARVIAQLKELDLQAREDIIVIDARSDNKPTGSKA